MPTEIARIRRYALVTSVAWTASIVCALSFFYYQESSNTLELAKAEARIALQKDSLYRKWAAGHGGVYVPVDDQTPPNPYLSQIPERDINTPSGRALTLVNPAYMTRQVFELGDKEKVYLRGHITSLKPIRPENTPDTWETEALRAFEKGELEASALVSSGSSQSMRLMRPFITEKGCLKCHAAQGYKLGDIRGGISVTVPMATFTGYRNKLVTGTAAAHGIIWLLGLGLIGVGRRTISKNILELQNSEERYRTIADFTSDWEYWLAPEGMLRYVSPSCESICGYTQDEFYCDPELMKRIVHPDDLELYLGHAHAGHNAAPEPVDFRIINRSGEVRWISHVCRTVLSRDGKDIGRRASNRDVTERKRAEVALQEQTAALEEEIAERQAVQEALQEQATLLEEEIEERLRAQEALRKSERFLSTIIETEPECVKMLDRDGQLIMMNSAGLAMIDVDTFEEVKGRCVYPMIEPQYRDAFIAMTREVFEGKPNNLVFEIVGRRGRHVWLDSNAVPFCDDAGEVVALLAITRDISERKRAEEKLRSSEEKFSKSFENAPLIMTITSVEDGRLLEVNNKFVELTGYGKEEVIGKTTLELGLIDAKDRQRIVDMFQNEGRISGLEIRTRTKHEKTIVSRYYGEFIRMGGEPRILSILLDVTDQRNLEEQLRQSQKMEAIGQLAGGVAHDFNNILTAIIGFSTILEMRMNKDDSLRTNVDQILAAADRAADLTRSLLAFSRKQLINPKPADLNQIIARTETFLKRIIGEDIDLKTKLHPDSLIINADAGQIEQVLMNLAANARDAMAKGGMLSIETDLVQIGADFIQAHGYGKAGEYAVISMTDTGAGMDEPTRKKLFEPFFTTKEVGKGTGLGLAIVHGLIKQHNGYINVYSEPGVGTTFTIYLPLWISEVEEKAVVAEEPLRGGNETILVADDDASLRELSVRFLSQFGYTVITAEDGQDAVDRFRENADAISLVILDVIMPRINGREACEEIRRARPDCKVIFTSGYAADILQNRGMFDDGLEYIAKPMSPTKLLKIVREVLDKAD